MGKQRSTAVKVAERLVNLDEVLNENKGRAQ